MKHAITVSPEMQIFIGLGGVAIADCPEEPVLLRFSDIKGGSPTVSAASIADLDAAIEDNFLIVIAAKACRRLFDLVPEEGGSWHLPGALREMVLRIHDCTAPELARDTLRAAKAVELFCCLLEQLQRGTMVAVAGSGELSELDTLRIAKARRMIDERWQEKLTLDSIARACGLNRGKLARGFRSMYDCSVADALTHQRLTRAQGMLRATDLPVKAIGYRCGYLNNASFTRAFSRHFGIAPTQVRQRAMSA